MRCPRRRLSRSCATCTFAYANPRQPRCFAAADPIFARRRYITAAKEVPTAGGKQAIIIYVPFRLLKQYRKIQSRLVRELEKKFSGKPVVIVAQRKMLGKTFARSTKTKVRSRLCFRASTADVGLTRTNCHLNSAGPSPAVAHPHRGAGRHP